MTKVRTRMHQTTLRFGPDLWAQLESEARRNGVSAAQYVRDATLSRLAYDAGKRAAAPAAPGPPDEAEQQTANVAAAREESEDAWLGSEAVWAQARLARERARSVRDRARATQAAHVHAREEVEGPPALSGGAEGGKA